MPAAAFVPIRLLSWKLWAFLAVYLGWYLVVRLNNYDIAQGSPWAANYDMSRQLSTFAVTPILFLASILISTFISACLLQYKQSEELYHLILASIQHQVALIDALLRHHQAHGHIIKELGAHRAELAGLPKLIVGHLCCAYEAEAQQASESSDKIANALESMQGRLAMMPHGYVHDRHLTQLEQAARQIRDQLAQIEAAFRSATPRAIYAFVLIASFYVFGVASIPILWSHYGFLWGSIASGVCIIALVGVLEGAVVIHPVFSRESPEYESIARDTRIVLRRIEGMGE